MMNRRTHEPNALSRLVLSLLLVLQVAAAGSAQTPSAPAKPAGQPRGSGDGRHEGIKVHGHWVIDVRNPDGSLAQHRDVENALATVGAMQLAAILARTSTPGTWIVALAGNPSLCGTTAAPKDCFIYEPQATDLNVPIASGLDRSFQTSNLLVSVDGPQHNRIVVSGTANASRDGSIILVTTQIGNCAATVSPTACTERGGLVNGNTGNFTRAFAAEGSFTPVPVKPGQIIQVTVTISFS